MLFGNHDYYDAGQLSYRPMNLPAQGGETPSVLRSRGQYFEKDEVWEVLSRLSDTEIKQMVSAARIRLMGNSARPGHVEAEDLFIEAAIGTLERRRKWKRGIPTFTHFFKTMGSIRHQRFEQAARFTPLAEIIAASQDRSLAIMEAQASVARLKEHLRGDTIALNILESMTDEMRPRHAQHALGVSAKVYWAARKRIRRLAERLPDAAHFRRRTPRKARR